MLEVNEYRFQKSIFYSAFVKKQKPLCVLIGRSIAFDLHF